MMYFTVEEVNIIQYCVSKKRAGMVQELLLLLRHSEGNLRDLIAATINKLETASDEEIERAIAYPAETKEDEENGR